MTCNWTKKILKGAWLLALTPSLATAQDHQPGRLDRHSPFDLAAPYQGIRLSPPKFDNSARIQDLLKGDKLLLSLNDAIALALENNLDLAIARYNLNIAETDILRTKGGGTVRGVDSGLVSGTPGGGIGGFGSGAPGGGAGGTSTGAGGAGSGAGGIVQSTIGTGAEIQPFDPLIISGVSLSHVASPLSNVESTGTSLFRQNTGLVNFLYTQTFGSGTSVQMNLNNMRETDNSPYTTLIPAISSSFSFSISQRLLSGFGPGSNLRFVHIAKNNREISDVAFRNQVIATVTQIQNIYWDLVNAYENAAVKRRSVELASQTLADNRKQVELRAMAPIEVLRAESEVDNRNQQLIAAESDLELQELLMKNAVTRDMGDASLGAARVIPTDTMTMSETEPVIPTQDLVSDALQHRPELAQARMDLANRQITRESARNALLPALDLVASYGGSGLAGVPNQYQQSPVSVAGNSTGFTNAFGQAFNGTAPNYQVGFSLTIPLRNRIAKADQERSELEFRQAELRLRQLQNQIAIEVRNAQFALRQNRARVEAAQKARELAQRNFDIQQNEFQLGASSSVQVLQAGRDLAVAESNLVAANSLYEKSRVELDRSVGMTLVRNGIDLQDAVSGNVNVYPHVPGVVRQSSAAN
jgi:outer membrane protein TolC